MIRPPYHYVFQIVSFADDAAVHSRSHVEVLRIGSAAAKRVRQPLCSLMDASPSTSDMLGRVQSVVLAYAKYTEGSKSRVTERSPSRNAR